MERHGITAIQYVSLSQHDDERVSQETSSKAYLFLIKRLCQLRTLSENFNFIFTSVCRTSHTSHFDRNTLTLSFDMPTLWLVMQRERLLHVNVKWQKIIEKNNNEKENTNRTEPNRTVDIILHERIFEQICYDRYVDEQMSLSSCPQFSQI